MAEQDADEPRAKRMRRGTSAEAAARVMLSIAKPAAEAARPARRTAALAPTPGAKAVQLFGILDFMGSDPFGAANIAPLLEENQLEGYVSADDPNYSPSSVSSDDDVGGQSPASGEEPELPSQSPPREFEETYARRVRRRANVAADRALPVLVKAFRSLWIKEREDVWHCLLWKFKEHPDLRRCEFLFDSVSSDQFFVQVDATLRIVHLLRYLKALRGEKGKEKSRYKELRHTLLGWMYPWKHEEAVGAVVVKHWCTLLGLTRQDAALARREAERLSTCTELLPGVQSRAGRPSLDPTERQQLGNLMKSICMQDPSFGRVRKNITLLDDGTRVVTFESSAFYIGTKSQFVAATRALVKEGVESGKLSERVRARALTRRTGTLARPCTHCVRLHVRHKAPFEFATHVHVIAHQLQLSGAALLKYKPSCCCVTSTPRQCTCRSCYNALQYFLVLTKSLFGHEIGDCFCSEHVHAFSACNAVPAHELNLHAMMNLLARGCCRSEEPDFLEYDSIKASCVTQECLECSSWATGLTSCQYLMRRQEPVTVKQLVFVDSPASSYEIVASSKASKPKPTKGAADGDAAAASPAPGAAVSPAASAAAATALTAAITVSAGSAAVHDRAPAVAEAAAVRAAGKTPKKKQGVVVLAIRMPVTEFLTKVTLALKKWLMHSWRAQHQLQTLQVQAPLCCAGQCRQPVQAGQTASQCRQPASADSQPGQTAIQTAS